MGTQVNTKARDTFELAKSEIAFAYENVRFFQKHMDDVGLRPADIRSAEDILRLPPTRKMHYRKNFPAGVLAKGKTLKDRFLFRSQSSGTGGERLVTVTQTFVLADRMNKTLSVNPRFDAYLMSVPKRRTCRYAAPNCSDVECATPNSTIADRTLPDGTLVLPVHHDLLSTTDAMVGQAIREITEYSPHWLYLDPTHLAFLIRGMKKRGLSPPACGAVALTYTLPTQVARRQIRAFFPEDTLVAAAISMSEFGWLAMECPEGRMHLNTHSYHIELLTSGRKAEPGELAELVITSIGDRVSPHIRYQTGDHYRLLDEACPCGHAFPVVRYEGRLRDMLQRKGKVILTPRGLDDLVGPAEWMDIYKMHQVDDDYFVFRFSPNERFEASHEEELARRLRAALGEDARVEMEQTSYIASERSGKFASCTSAASAVDE